MPKGLYTNAEFVDAIIQDINNGIRNIATGDYVAWSASNVQIVHKLINLKKGIISDLQNREETIADLKRQLRQCGVEVVEIPASELLKDGEQNGGN